MRHQMGNMRQNRERGRRHDYLKKVEFICAFRQKIVTTDIKRIFKNATLKKLSIGPKLLDPSSSC